MAILHQSRQVDIATLVLIYVMLGLGLNIVVGFAGLLTSLWAYAVGAYTYALVPLGRGFGLRCPCRRDGGAIWLFTGFRYCACAVIISPLSRWLGEIIACCLLTCTISPAGQTAFGIPKPTVFDTP